MIFIVKLLIMRNLINSWKAKNKQKDKLTIEIRFGRFTLLEINWDKSKKETRLMFFNFGVEIKKSKKSS